MTPVFFADADEMRSWFERHHHRADEIWVGYYKRHSGKLSITWPQSVDQALCYGWIDGVRKSIDGVSYMIRFTSRRRGSAWSAINIRRVAELKKLGLMRPAGLKAFEERSEKKSQIYSYEQRNQAKLDATSEKKFKANRRAWEFFQAQAPWYRRTSTYWVMTAKKEETRQKRLQQLIVCSSRQERIPQLSRNQ